jgi:hypothetical protein
MNKKWKNFTAEIEKKKFEIFLIKNCNLLIPRPPQRTSKAGEAFSPQKRTPSTSNMIFLHFYLFLWAIFALLNPDSKFGSTDLIGSGSETLIF